MVFLSSHIFPCWHPHLTALRSSCLRSSGQRRLFGAAALGTHRVGTTGSLWGRVLKAKLWVWGCLNPKIHQNPQFIIWNTCVHIRIYIIIYLYIYIWIYIYINHQFSRSSPFLGKPKVQDVFEKHPINGGGRINDKSSTSQNWTCKNVGKESQASTTYCIPSGKLT